MYIPNPSNNQQEGNGQVQKTGYGELFRSASALGTPNYLQTNNNQYKGNVFFSMFNTSSPNYNGSGQQGYNGILDRSKLPQFEKPYPYEG